MPKMLCTCGETLAYGEIPCRIEYKFISDIDYDTFQGKIDAEELYGQMKSIIECPNCYRLWVFWKGFQKPPTEYIQGIKGTVPLIPLNLCASQGTVP